jgi:NADH-quinone oxidoreductase subunit L
VLAAEVVDNVPWIFANIWVVPALMAASFVIILLFGKRLPFKGSEVGIAAVGVAFVLSCWAGYQWIDAVESADHGAEHGEEEYPPEERGEEGPDELEGPDDDEVDEQSAPAVGGPGGSVTPVALGAPASVAAPAVAEGGYGHVSPDPVVRTITWLQSGGREFGVGTLVDGQSLMLLFVVTFISLLVHVFSTDYVGGDRRYTHYFAFLSLFTASMLFMVLAENTLQLLVGWELVGMCSFALIGHWWEDKNNSDAALKAFLTNRVGDMGLIIGVAILFFAAGGTFSILEINTAALDGQISHLVLLVASISLMAAVMSKSGQFFLHTWLPDAMAGPTPVSALIHAATMVVAGVYLIGRLYPVFWEGLSIAGSSINLMAAIGGITTIVGALLAFVQRDIKKVLAYSTISQLGYMVMALGVGAWTAGMFHLFTHAFFKACLFLGAGSVSHAVHHSFDMKADMGGLRKYMPITFTTFVIGSVALAGIPPLAGFWSKDEILAGTGAWPGTGGNGDYYLMLVFGLMAAAMTAAYMTRCVYLVFFGEYRGHGHPHESGPRLTVPLIILAFMAVVAGFANLPSAWFPDGIALKFEEWVEPAGVPHFPAIAHATASITLAVIATAVAVGGIVVAGLYYRAVARRDARATELADGPTTRYPAARTGYRFLEERYYLDHLYSGVVAGGTKGPLARAAYAFNQRVLDGIINGAARVGVASGRVLYRFVDQGAIDGAVNSSGYGAGFSGQILRRIQSGSIRQYATLMFAGAALLAGVFIVVI